MTFTVDKSLVTMDDRVFRVGQNVTVVFQGHTYNGVITDFHQHGDNGGFLCISNEEGIRIALDYNGIESIKHQL